MHPDLGADDARARARLRAFLTELPWGWPAPSEPAHARACTATGLEAAPPLRPGEALLLTERGGAGSLWALRLGAGREGTCSEVALDAQDVWRRAADLLSSALPLLWRSPRPSDPRVQSDALRPLSSAPPRLRRAHSPVAAHAGASSGHAYESVVTGDSLGLAILLAQASLVLGLPLPDDLAASATIGPYGELGPVGGLEVKLRVLVRLAPRVRRVVVAATQHAEAAGLLARIMAEESNAAHSGEDSTPRVVVPCQTVREAVRLALPDDAIDAAWSAAGDDPDQRAEHVERLLQLALADRSECPDWRPVERAAALAAEVWRHAAPHEAWTLGFVAAIAARHVGRATDRPITLPSEAELRTIPQPRRARVLAHLVQQSADTGTPHPEDVERLAFRQLVRGPDAFPDHLRLAGALGRLAATRGRFDVALALQLEAADGWLARPELHHEVSYPLSEAYRLAAVLESVDALGAADRLRTRAVRAGALPPTSPWVESSRARALLALCRPRAEILATLDPILAGAPAHCTYVTRRARRALAVRDGEADVVAHLDADLAMELEAARHAVTYATSITDRLRAHDHERDVETCLALVRLDAAGADDGARTAAEARLRELHPELCRMLEAGTGCQLRTCFPY